MMHRGLRKLQMRLRWRKLGSLLKWLVPMLMALVFLSSRIPRGSATFAALMIAGVVLVVLVIRIWIALDTRAAVRVANVLLPSLEDSADLLVDQRAIVPPLLSLQRRRIAARLDDAPRLRLPRQVMPRFVLPALLGLAVLMFASVYLPVADSGPDTLSAGPEPATATMLQTRILSAVLGIKAPSYTGLPARSESGLEVEAAEGSNLHWKIRFDPEPAAASLVFHDGQEIPLVAGSSGWSAQTTLSTSSLYRIELVSAPALEEDRLYRLDALVDQPPDIRVIAPGRTLTLLEAGQNTWALDFEVSDDYGIGDARLAITLAQGSGEQVTVSERSQVLRADPGGEPRHRRDRRTLDLGALGFTAGDDLIVRLIVSDQREPLANVSRSASYILRAPAGLASDSEGVEGIVQKVLPAYFRSQRQIIIDSEALLADRANLDADEFLRRSDTIGVDQKILRLRYGQFLGEEFESSGGESHSGDAHESDQDKPTQQDALSEDHGHVPAPASAFGSEANVLADFGHTHDHAEAATLLDPETRKILKSALAEMWQAELHLRLGDPRTALPFENRALGFIKQVQQSTRIYLARVGLELPPVDESRRLSGERKELRDRPGFLQEVEQGNEVLINAYQSLISETSSDFDELNAWLRESSKRLPDALGLIAAVDELRRQPDCVECRTRLLDRLWAALPNPPSGSRLRRAADASGERYLDSLHEEGQP